MSAKTDVPRDTVARHARLRSPHPIATLAKIAAAIVAVLVVSGGGVAAFAALYAAGVVADNSIDIGGAALPPELGEIEGGVNLLMVGTDSCEGQDPAIFPVCADRGDDGERNDVTMLVHISDEPRRITVVSFPRDMIVPIPSCSDGQGGSYSAMSAQMLNVSYGYGGLTCTVATIEELTGQQIQFAAAIRWSGVIAMSDAIGGVDVCVGGQIDDRNTDLHLTAGTHTLTGLDALKFLRIRHGIGDGSDLGRISNQQQFMSSMVRKLQSDGVLSNPGTLLGLATTAVQQVDSGQLVLSSSLASPTRMVQIAMAGRSVPYEDIVFVQYPTGYSNDGVHVLPLTSAATTLFDALAENRPLELTGEASGGGGVEVTGEVTDPNATSSPTDAATTAPSDASTDPSATAAADGAVELPSSITGQTALQSTCTVPEN